MRMYSHVCIVEAAGCATASMLSSCRLPSDTYVHAYVLTVHIDIHIFTDVYTDVCKMTANLDHIPEVFTFEKVRTTCLEISFCNTFVVVDTVSIYRIIYLFQSRNYSITSQEGIWFTLFTLSTCIHSPLITN